MLLSAPLEILFHCFFLIHMMYEGIHIFSHLRSYLQSLPVTGDYQTISDKFHVFGDFDNYILSSDFI